MAQNISNLPLGAKVKFGKYSVNGETAQNIVWLIVAKNHESTPAYPTNSVTLYAENVLDLRCFDCRESAGDTNRVKYGNNRYSLSNIDQWLNKDNGAGAWFAPTHSVDNPPGATWLSAPYDNRPGFLNAFSDKEKTAILNTTIRTRVATYDGGGQDDVSRKIFLPSLSELAGQAGEGAKWAYADSCKDASLTEQCRTNSPLKPTTTKKIYWLRSSNTDTTHTARGYDPTTPRVAELDSCGEMGVRPALNLSATQRVSDTTDNEGCYTIVWNSPPSVPPTLNAPSTIYGGKYNSLSWGAASDADGDSITYVLECAYNGGGFTQIYSGTALSYSHFVTYGETSIQYRVKAVDTHGTSSSYTTSGVRTIANNQAPVISGADGELGVKTSGFTQTYSITDADGDTVTVVERIDGAQIRSYVATLGATNTFSVTGDTWLSQTNGSHTMTITVSDSFGNSAVRTYRFTKNITSFSVQNSVPMSADTMPTRIAMTINRNIPPEASFKVEVCNNGYDTSPTWEDATSSVENNRVYMFTNTSKTASSWGVKIRVTVNRNNASGACYITAIGGNFE